MIRSILEHLRRLRAQPADELTRAQRSIKFGYDLVRHCGRELREDRASQVAAALTYHTLFGMLPMLVLMLFMVAAFAGETRREDLKKDAINFLLDWAYSEGGNPMGVAGPAAGAAVDAPAPRDEGVGDTPPLVPDDASEAQRRAEEFNRARADLRKNVTDLVNQLEGVNFRSISVVGVLVFMWAATGLLTTIERSFNNVYDVLKSRPWYMRLPLYYTVITLGPLVLLAGLWVQAKLFDLLHQINLPGADASALVNGIVGVGGVLSPVLTAWIVLTLMYVLLPNTKVSLRAATIGGSVAAIVWVVTIQLFAIYVRKAGIASLYGAIALVPLFLLWLWLTWFVVLFGLELTYTLQMMRGRQFKSENERQTERIVYDPRWVVPVMAEVGRHFLQGKAVRPDKLAQMLDLPTSAVTELCELLRTSGQVHVVEQGQIVDAYTLAMPPDRIALSQLIELGSKTMTRASRHADPPTRSVMQKIDQAQRQAVGDATLADVIENDKN